MNTVNCALNVEEIMEEIRREIKNKGYVNDVMPFSTVPIAIEYQASQEGSDDVEALLDDLRRSASIEAYRTINSRPGILGKCIIFFKKAIRKCIKFYIEPIVADQNRYNTVLIQCLEQMHSRNKALMAENETIKKELEHKTGV